MQTFMLPPIWAAKPVSFFNEREIAHMEDVQGLLFKSHCPAPDLPGGLRRYAFYL